MARFSIYSKDGKSIRYIGEPQYRGSYMGVDSIEFGSISSPNPIDWEIGDYIEYHRTGLTYKLYDLPQPKKTARKDKYGASFEYSNVKFYADTKELEIAPFRDLVPKDNTIHFSTRPEVNTYEDVEGVARRIQECMDDLYPGKWRIEVYSTDDADLNSLMSETKEYSVSNGSCLDALSQIYETWKNIGWIHSYDSANKINVITIGRANVRDDRNTSDAFSYGLSGGLTAIKKASANEGEFATRLYVYGSERNIQTRYYNGLDILNKDSVDIRNLMLPIEKWGKTDGLPDARKAYLQADDAIVEKYGLIPKIVYFDGSENEEIFPSIENLTMADIRSAMIAAGQGDSEYLPDNEAYRVDKIALAPTPVDGGTKEEMEERPVFTLGFHDMGFNLAEQGKLTESGTAVISMKSGACAGREFEVKRYIGPIYGDNKNGDRGYEILRSWDDSLGEAFPNKNYPIKAGDEFVLLDIPMPDYYITLAQKELLEAGEKMLADYTRVSAFYEPSLDPIRIKKVGQILTAGMYMQVYDDDIIDTENNTDYVLIDTLAIDEKGDIPTYRITLRDQKRAPRTNSALEEMIVDAKESAKKDIDNVRRYTDRRFRSSQETLELLQAAFTNFSEGISPVTVRTMGLLLGDESLQFKFTESRDSLESIPCPVVYDNTTRKFKATEASLIHMTLGIDAVTSVGTRTASDYKSWDLPEWESESPEDTEARYLYVRASKTDASAGYVMSTEPIAMDSADGYYFLVGILNSEYNGSRDFVTLYSFTEILPGQITTDILRSGNSKLVIDLENAIITARDGATIQGSLKIEVGSTGLTNLSEWAEKQAEIDANKTATEAVARELLDTKNKFNQSILEINNKLDGVVESYFFKYSPSRTNEPALTWINEGTEADHVGDTFTNVSLDGEDAGKSWRWLMQDDSTYDWNPIADSDAAKALALAGQAQATADGKTTIFIAKPNREYFVGDTWIVGDDYIPNGYKVGDILTSSRRSQGYVESDWSKQVRYTDDSTLWAWSENNVISPMHHQALREEMERIYYEYESIEYNVQRYGLEAIDEWTAYEDAFSDYYQDLDYLVTSQDAETANFLPTFRETYYTRKTAILDAIDAKAKQGVDDLAYLKSTFGTVVDVDGVVLGEMVAVKDEVTEKVDAFLNGSIIGKDDTHGKLLIAAGIDDITKPEEAKTRVYEDGHITSNSLELKDGCSIGKLKVTSKGISAQDGCDSPGKYREYASFNETHFVVSYTYNTGSACVTANQLSLRSDGVQISRSSTYGKGWGAFTSYGFVVSYHSKNSVVGLCVGTLTVDEEEAFDALSDGHYSAYAKTGVFAGLRPATRVISTTGSSTSPITLTDLDYSVFVNVTSGTTYIRLPQTPQDGQEYHIETKGADVVLLSAKSIFSHKDNKTATTFTVASRGVFRMKYYAGINQWTFCWIDSY